MCMCACTRILLVYACVGVYVWLCLYTCMCAWTCICVYSVDVHVDVHVDVDLYIAKEFSNEDMLLEAPTWAQLVYNKTCADALIPYSVYMSMSGHVRVYDHIHACMCIHIRTCASTCVCMYSWSGFRIAMLGGAMEGWEQSKRCCIARRHAGCFNRGAALRAWGDAPTACVGVWGSWVWANQARESAQTRPRWIPWLSWAFTRCSNFQSTTPPANPPRYPSECTWIYGTFVYVSCL